MSSEWDEYADGWDSNEDVVRYSEQAFQSLCECVTLDNLRVLDFGCGTGCLTEKLAKQADTVVGLDTSSAMLTVLNGKGLGNVQTLGDELTSELVAGHPYLQDRFDLITASSVCGFLEDYDGALRLLKSLLTPGGCFVQWDWLAAEAKSEHGFTEQAMLESLTTAGFESVLVSRPFSMPAPQGETPVVMGFGLHGRTHQSRRTR
jgi:predicted TPR repeat methyltransferase